MEKVIIIANEFPPMGGAGVQRSIKFTKYLPEFGYKPIIITKDYKGTLIDKSLLVDLPADLEIHRLKSYDLVNWKGPLRLPMKFVGLKLVSPDPEYFWYLLNRKKVSNLIAEQDIKIVYTTSFPYSSHLMGLYLKKKHPHIRWVVDFRDEWTNNPYHLDSVFMQLRLGGEKKKESAVTSNCDYLVTNTPFMLSNFVRDNPKLKDHSTFIPNGYDSDDFKGLETVKADSEKFVITYTGSLYGRRNLNEFLEGLSAAIKKGHILKKDLEIRVVGNIYERVLNDYAIQFNLEGVMKQYGYLPHKDSIAMLKKSQILLLVIGSGKGSENFYTGKIFEYINVDRPILALVPPHGAAAQVIEQTHTGSVVDTDDIDGIEAQLTLYYEAWKNGGIPHEPLWDEVQSFSRKKQTEQLSKIFQGIHPGERLC